MKQVIYVDELLFINVAVNYFLLLTTSLVVKTKVNKFRILIGAFVGGLFSFTAFLPPLGFLPSLCLRISVAFILTLVTFSFKSVSLFFKHCVTLFSSTALFAGVLSAIWLIANAGTAVYVNSAIYFDVNVFVLIFSSAGCYLMIYFFRKIFKKNLAEELTCEIEIEVFGQIISGKGMLDTGNSLREPFSSFPVVVCTKKLCSPLIPDKLLKTAENLDFEAIDERWKKRLRVVNCSTVSGSAAMFAFRPDRLKIKTYKRSFSTDRVYIAVSKSGSYLNEKYDAIMPSEIFEGAEDE
ncbi:MAG: sigma-E processing peptidase SpoIIGA [Clostridia bacterium]|nr:sigma-E processing peptidase SpoIIGA [Clostridia bacterium]